MEKLKGFYSKAELAESLGVSKRTVDNWMSNGKISFTKVGRKVIFSELDLSQLIACNRREAFFYQEEDDESRIYFPRYNQLNKN
jgi:excisionase family DNA binding protein